ncbi:MAG: 4-hydroxyphenylpyruvate dioxygenase [Candidatus Marinimicrobia bacterium]|nr:4-hydroxyphenylpyruvate dioxygenase [Candidatus Neomarinimicrobiota bacterium]
MYITDKWEGTEYFDIQAFKFIEFYVGNAKQVVHFYRTAFGFEAYAYCGPETGVDTHVSYVLKNKKIFFVFTTALKSSHPASDWIKKHGDGVKDVAFSVLDVQKCYDSAMNRGAISNSEPIIINNENGSFGRASIKTYGDNIHSFIDDSNYKGLWAPKFIKLNLPELSISHTHLVLVDHIVGNVEWDKMDYWREYYEKVFGFSTFVRFDEGDISTKYSALKSIVLRSKNWKIKLPINEPAKGLKKSQIEEYLDFHEGAGVQHIAILTDDIISSISSLKQNGVEFLDIPETYYDNLIDRVGGIDEDIKKLKDLSILVDRDESGYLLQIFTKPIQDRPTLFIEIIQRKGSQGFGQGNFQALFESIEKAQEERGNF